MLRTRLPRLTPSLLAKCRALARELEALPNRTAGEHELMQALWVVTLEGPAVERLLAARELTAAAALEP